MSRQSDVEFDCAIVGGGAAGCVLANRLSAVLDKMVLLWKPDPTMLRAANTQRYANHSLYL
jgi:2-polyprenyl-6-methoxyphenol hydroxylase-like FAD-dependent oxidoreductase